MSERRYHNESFPLPTPSRLRKELRLRGPPWWMVGLLIFTLTSPIVPIAWLIHKRMSYSNQPRIHLLQDMGVQPRYGPQATSDVFADGRAMRQPVPGTVARGTLVDNHMDRGYVIAADATGNPAITFFDSPPVSLRDDPNLLARGKSRFTIYCAPCHGDSGNGRGVVNDRAMILKDSKWVQASNLMEEVTRKRADGWIFSAISNGVRSMPPYASQIEPRDRWAIVAYLRELQKNSPVAAPVAPASQPTTQSTQK